jgi:aerobic C4-dicarboxylate transport protein
MTVEQAVAASPAPGKKRSYEHLYFQVLCGMIAGVVLAYIFPAAGASMKPLGDAFIKLIRMIIAPVIFCTVVHGVASMHDLKILAGFRLGRKSKNVGGWNGRTKRRS